jgi:hypothetical protein
MAGLCSAGGTDVDRHRRALELPTHERAAVRLRIDLGASDSGLHTKGP